MTYRLSVKLIAIPALIVFSVISYFTALSQPANDGSLRYALANRKSIRDFTGGNLSLANLKDLVWAAYGHTHDRGDIKMRTAPSAGATYPIDLYFVIEKVDSLKDGIYRYDRNTDDIALVKDGAFLDETAGAAYGQESVSESNITTIFVYDPSRIEPKYADNARKFAYIECGHIAQNILLMATSLELGSVPVGAADTDELGKILSIGPGKEAVYIVCVGTVK